MLKTPTLSQLIHICSNLEPDQVREHAAMSFGDFNAEQLAMSLYQTRGPSHVFVTTAGIPYMAAGFSMFAPGVSQSWAVSTAARIGHDLEVTRLCRRAIEGLLADNCRRLQTMCAASREDARRWYRALGLEQESTMRSYGANGEDFVMYSRVRAL